MENKTLVGNFPMKWVPLASSLLVMATCVLNYYICSTNGTCKPWPYSTITACSNYSITIKTI